MLDILPKDVCRVVVVFDFDDFRRSLCLSNDDMVLFFGTAFVFFRFVVVCLVFEVGTVVLLAAAAVAVAVSVVLVASLSFIA
jgi:hypothetical protein